MYTFIEYNETSKGQYYILLDLDTGKQVKVPGKELNGQ